LRFLFLQTHATSYSFCSPFLYTVKEKGGKPDRKPYPLPYGLRNPYRNRKVWELARLCPEALMKLYVHEFGFRKSETPERVANGGGRGDQSADQGGGEGTYCPLSI
jgi:hypothetical protein